MKSAKLFHFEDRQFRNIGKLLADRDAFIVFYNLAHSEPLNISKLCGMFRREPNAIRELLEMLSGIGLARKSGGLHGVTAFGGKVMEFLDVIAERIDLPAAELTTVANSTRFATSGPAVAQSAATNNTVVSDFHAASAVRLVGKEVVLLKANQVANESEGKNFDNREPSSANAARSYNYL